jgi:hypothetical protein
MHRNAPETCIEGRELAAKFVGIKWRKNESALS